MTSKTTAARDAYITLRQESPDLFDNPRNASFEIVFDPIEVNQVEELADNVAEPWRMIGVHYRDPYISVIRDAVRFPNGTLGAYSRVALASGRTPGVAVLPRHEGRILLLRQFRHATRRFHIEAPRGFGEPGATPEENARRELREELGLEAASLLPLGRIDPDTGISNSALDLFFAEAEGMPRGDVNEGIVDIVAYTPTELKAAIADGTITDSFTLAMIARLVARGKFIW